jgi:maltose/moltooligosaccharide transporter
VPSQELWPELLASHTHTLSLSIGFDKNAVSSSNIPHLTVIAFMIGAVFSISTVVSAVNVTSTLQLLRELRTFNLRKRAYPATLTETVVCSGGRNASDHATASVGMKLLQR